MTDTHPHRTVHRGVAILLIPSSLALLELDTLAAGADPAAQSLRVERVIGLVTLTVATVYLDASVTRQLVRAADTPF